MDEGQILRKLERRGIKPTAMRILVLKILLKQEYAISLTDLETEFERADRITLFRTLKTFEKQHLIHRIDDGAGAVKYALCGDNCECGQDDLHIHFYCTRCRKTYCMPENQVPNISLPTHFIIQKINIVIKGICDRCTR